jgi:hypothetical protein
VQQRIGEDGAMSVLWPLLALLPANVPPRPPDPPPALAAKDIDARLREEWTRQKVEPAPQIDDAAFLRRLSIDVVGTLPTPDEVRAYLADPATDKRARAVERLLASPRFATHWARMLENELLGGQPLQNGLDAAVLQSWLTAQIAGGTAWDALSRALIAAEGRTDEKPATEWLIRFRQRPGDFAGTVSRLFLGVQIQCAECHDHKTERWTQHDFRAFAAPFAKVRYAQLEQGKGRRIFEVTDLRRLRAGKRATAEMMERVEIANTAPRALDGTDLSDADNPRQALATWIAAPGNPWFARAWANRLWAHFMGSGFFEPVDDQRPGNPADLPELLDRLAAEAIRCRFDLRTMVRLLTTTELYRRGASAGAERPILWSSYKLRPLGADELVDAILTATRLETVIARMPPERAEKLELRIRTVFGFVFRVDEDTDEDSFDGTIAQALALMNGLLIDTGTSPIPGGAVARLVHGARAVDGRIEELYLRTLSRRPSAEELEHWRGFVASGASLSEHIEASETASTAASASPPKVKLRVKGMAQLADPEGLVRIRRRVRDGASPEAAPYSDLLWALLNSSEFYFNH